MSDCQGMRIIGQDGRGLKGHEIRKLPGVMDMFIILTVVMALQVLHMSKPIIICQLYLSTAV